MTLDAGSLLGPYRILGLLGAGGMGEVYRARDARLARDIAIKVLSEAMASNPLGLQRFIREARAVAALNHPHIVTIFSTEEASGLRFMTMELIDGKTLDRLIPPHGMPLAKIFDIAIPLVDALDAAHRKNILHRDLKPGNVMVTEEGRVKVLDFGLALNTGDAGAINQSGESRPLHTQAGLILGTAPYMSPEQIEARPLDHRTDIFSLGVMLYEMVVGVRPFRGDTWPGTMASILKDEARPLDAIRPGLPVELTRLIAKCLSKNPGERPASSTAVLRDLRVLREAHEGTSGPATAEVSAIPGDSGAAASAPAAPARGSVDSQAAQEPAPVRVLIVDDDASLCRVLTDYLAPLGYEIETVTNGLIGLERALSGDFAAVILDVRLPGLNGIEVLRRLRERSKVRVILWSAMGDEPDRVAGLEIGADDYLPKSSSPRELLARLRSVLRR
jgi:serine/threonine protein kinase/CheY-like chemotaxis protein